MLLPWQITVEPLAVIIGLAGLALMVIAILTVLVLAGLLLTTLTWYPVPLLKVFGKVQGTTALTLPVTVPITTGEAKLPVPLLSCTVNILPVLNVPFASKPTESASPAHKVFLETLLTVMEGETTLPVTVKLSLLSRLHAFFASFERI